MQGQNHPTKSVCSTGGTLEVLSLMQWTAMHSYLSDKRMPVSHSPALIFLPIPASNLATIRVGEERGTPHKDDLIIAATERRNQCIYGLACKHSLFYSSRMIKTLTCAHGRRHTAAHCN